MRPEVVTLENVREITTWGPLVAKRDKSTGRVMRLDGSIAAKGERVPIAEQWLVPDPRHKGRIWRCWLKHMRGLGYSFEHRSLCCADYGVPTIRTRLFGVALADGGPVNWPARTHAPRDKAKGLGLRPWVGAHTIIDWSLPVKSIFDRKKPLAEATMRRIARGVMRYVIEAADPFIVPICQTSATTPGRSARDPLATLTTAKGGELALVAASLVRTDQASAAGRNGIHDPREPINTLHTAGGMAVSAVHLEKFSENSAGLDPREPVNTIMAGGQGHAVIAATLVQTGYGEREGHAPRIKDIGEPAGTQVAGGGKEALVAAFLAKHNTDVVGSDLRDPVWTLTTGGDRGQAQIAPVLASLRGTARDGRDAREPLPAQSAGGNHEMLILPFLQTYYGSGENNHDPRDPLHTVTVNDRHGLVTVEVNGQTMVITDICMRMLDPLEGARAHEFDPASLQHEIEVTDKRGKMTRRKPNKTEIGHLVGNSVPPRMVRLLAECNVRRELMVAAE